MGALETALNYQPPESSIRAAQGITEKAKEDEERAYRVQRLREAEQNEKEIIKEKQKRQKEFDTFQFLKRQEAEKKNRANITKQEDQKSAQILISQVQDAIKQEEQVQMNRKEKARYLASEQRRQASMKDEARCLQSGMSPRERAYNRDMFETLASRNNGSGGSSTLSDTGRRLFG